MTVCNMTIEGGGRAGMIAPDETTFAWFRDQERPGRARRAPSSTPRSRAGASCAATRAPFDKRDRDRRLRDLAAGDLGHEPRDGARGHRARARAGGLRQPRRPRGDRTGAALHGAGAGHADRADRHRPRVHRLVHELAHRRPARGRRGRRGPQGRRRASARWSSPAPSRSRRRPRPRASTRSSATPASTGASPAARCAWA